MTKEQDLNSKQFVSFYLVDELFGIDIKLVNEVNPTVHIVPIPLSAAHIRGYVNIRGQVVLVIDLAVMFGREPRPILPTSHIVIFKTTQDFIRLRTTDLELDLDIFGDKPVAVLVDNIGDVISLSPDNIETPTRNIIDEYSQFVKGVSKLEDELLIIINPLSVLKYQSRSAGGRD